MKNTYDEWLKCCNTLNLRFRTNMDLKRNKIKFREKSDI